MRLLVDEPGVVQAPAAPRDLNLPLGSKFTGNGVTYTKRSSIKTFCENHNDNDPANKYLRCDLYNIQCLIHCQCFFFNKILMLKKIKDVS